jgi:MFS family permease
MMSASIVLLLALSWGGVRYPWFSTQIGALIAGSVALWVIFVWRITTVQEPFLPLHTLRNPIVRNGILARGFAQGALAGLTIFLPLYFEIVRHLSVAEAGFALIPLMGGMVTAGQTTGRLCVRYDHYKMFPLISLPVCMSVLLIFAIWPTELPIWAMYALLAVVGMGFGPLMPISTVMVQNAVPLTEMGITTSALNFARSFGGALFVALFGAILLGGAGGEGISISTLMRAGSIEFGGIFRYVFLAGAAGVFVAIVFVAITEEVPLRRTPHL